jgi:hypothetical protein
LVFCAPAMATASTRAADTVITTTLNRIGSLPQS